MQSKPCDWICAGCKNYNYSFRKMCNRCQQCSRDNPGTRFIPNSMPQQPCILDGLKLKEPNLGGSGHSQAESIDDQDHDNVVFSQALFLQDLSKHSGDFNQGFSFQKTCNLCKTQNYFYQARCSQCGFSSFA